ncbi:hypothetical protein F4809DRAFT_611629 [Biscogniauxia mediterranea]|nr:hypothetical protein F4809DRAFT_611629 [Biscogniauxia mediterranea]
MDRCGMRDDILFFFFFSFSFFSPAAADVLEKLGKREGTVEGDETPPNLAVLGRNAVVGLLARDAECNGAMGDFSDSSDKTSKYVL